MSDILSLALRPTTLSELYGQDSTVKAIRNHMLKRQPRTWMFHGPSGSGKTTLALIMADAYQCPHMKLWGDPCKACIAAHTSFPIHEINASGDRGVEELGKVEELSRYKPTNPAHRRVMILDEFQGASAAAMRLLLKPLEKPPEHTVWIICTTEPNKILETIRRRCVTYQLKTLSITQAEEFVKIQAKRAGVIQPLGPLLEQCHLQQISAPAMLLQALEKYAAGASPVEATAGTEVAGVNPFHICKALTKGDWATIAKIMKDAPPDSARYIQASTSGWMRSVLLRSTSYQEQRAAAASLLELNTNVPYTDAMMMNWLIATLNTVCARYRGPR